MSETTDRRNHDSTVGFSIKELFRDIKAELGDLRIELQREGVALEGRVALLEKDLSGFETRVKLHEALEGHPGGILRLAAIEIAVKALDAQEKTREKLATYVERTEQRSNEHRRWLIGIVILSAFQFLTFLFTIAKLTGALG